MVSFYRDGVGLEEFFRSDTCAFLKLGRCYLALYAANSGSHATSGAMLDLAVENVDATVAVLQGRGIVVETSDGHPVITDPAGNRVEFVLLPGEP